MFGALGNASRRHQQPATIVHWNLPARRVLAGWMLVGLAQTAVGQGGVTGGSREILALNFANGVPKEISLSSGLVVVDKDGVRMLRATAESEFRVKLPEDLPDKFTLEFELIAKEEGPSNDLSFRGTNNPTDTYAEVNWSPTSNSVVGGAVSGSSQTFTMTTPASLSETLTGQLVRILVSFEGDQLKLYTNGQRLYTVARRFARTRLLRVLLGGQGEENAVYLSRLRVAEGTATATSVVAQDPSGRFSPTSGRSSGSMDAPPPSPPPVPPPTPPPPTEPRPAPSLTPVREPTGTSSPETSSSTSVTGVSGIVAQVDAQGKASVSWQAVPGATSYFVVRWLVGDNVCCGNTSPPEGMASLTWQDVALPKGGTYGYRVYATTPSVIYAGEATVEYQPSAVIATASSLVLPQTESALAPITLKAPAPRTIKLAGLTGAGVVRSSPPPRTIALAAFSASAGFRPLTPAPRSIALGQIMAVGTAKTLIKAGTGSVSPSSRTIAVAGIVASGGFATIVVPPKAIPLAMITAKGGPVPVVYPKTIELVGVTAAGSTKPLLKNP